MRRASIASVVLLGCSSVSQADINDLRAQHEREKTRLDAVRAEIARAEAQAAIARERAVFERCRALWSEIRAEVVAAQADCAGHHAEHNMCEANNSARTAKGGIAGCLLGLAATAVLPGAGIPLAVAGCGAGAVAGNASGAECSRVTCDVDSARLTSEALARHGRSTLPLCGGYLGVQTVDGFGGTLVRVVEAQSPAAGAGIMANDVIQQVDGAATPGTYALYHVLNEKPPGEVVTLSVSRGGTAFAIRVQLGSRGQRTSL
jgi:hypothetical protein